MFVYCTKNHENWKKKILRFAFYELSKLTRKKKGNEAKSEATKKNLRYTKNNKSWRQHDCFNFFIYIYIYKL